MTKFTTAAKFALGAATASLLAASMPQAASAQPYGSSDPCNSRSVTGGIVGAGAGALIGSSLAVTHRDRPTGAVLGGLLGAVVGSSAGRSTGAGCNGAYNNSAYNNGYYDNGYNNGYAEGYAPGYYAAPAYYAPPPPAYYAPPVYYAPRYYGRGYHSYYPRSGVTVQYYGGY